MIGGKLSKYLSRKGPGEGRIILHSDLNNFFASAQCNERPALRDVPCAVCGNVEERHGIVLAKNEPAKLYGIRTGQAVWQARKLCPWLVTVLPDYALYLKYAKKVREIYSDYSDRVEPFGIDEAWIDLTGCPGVGSLSDGKRTADELRRRVKSETGLTVSVGVSDNKVFAKLASDYKKPDAATLFSPDNYMEVVGEINVSSLLYVGGKTAARLRGYGIRTIKDAACANETFLKSMLGKAGELLSCYASGFDISPVEPYGSAREIKSIGNSTTPPRDLCCADDVTFLCFSLAEEVCARLRAHGLLCKTLSVYIRTSSLQRSERQFTLPVPLDNAMEMSRAVMAFFNETYRWEEPIRSFGIRACNLSDRETQTQLCFFEGEQKRETFRRLDLALDGLRARFGDCCVRRAILLCDGMPNTRDKSGSNRVVCSFHPPNFGSII